MRIKNKKKRKMDIDILEVRRNAFINLEKPNVKNHIELQEVYYFNAGFMTGMRYAKNKMKADKSFISKRIVA